MSTSPDTPVRSEQLADLIRSGGAPFHENSVSYIFTCPKCGKQDKLYMYKETGKFVCWVCKDVSGFRGRPEYALTELLGTPLAELRRRLYGAVVPRAEAFLTFQLRDFFGDGDPVDEDAGEMEIAHWPLDFYPIDHQFGRTGAEYLASRGVDLDLARRYGLRYCPPQKRVVFPIEVGGQLRGWQGRRAGPTEFFDEETGECYRTPKAVTPKGVRKELALMFGDRLAESDHAVVCEGPMDAIKADLCGGNVATLGKAVSAAQVGLIRNSGVRKVYLGLDPDAVAESMRLCRELADLEVYLLAPPEPLGDLGEMAPGDVLEVFRRAPRIYPSTMLFYLERDPRELLALRRRERDRRLVRGGPLGLRR